MNATATLPAAPQPLLPATLRFAAAAAAAALLALVSLSAEHASHDAVTSAITTFGAARVTLPSVEVVGRRGPAAVKSSGSATTVAS